MRCRRFACGSTDLEATAVPYARRAANQSRPIGRLDARLLSAAMEVLEATARTSRGAAVATADVRLAVLVVHVYARDRELVERFWSRAATRDRPVDQGLGEPLAAIRHRLVERGWLPAAVLLDEVRTWPWDSPAPPGWLDPCVDVRTGSDGLTGAGDGGGEGA